MHFNLIDEKWIPVTRRDGSQVTIAPWEVTDRFQENPIISLSAPRPDFDGALVQFLIGIVQTAAAPVNNIEWKRKLAKPPAPEELRETFSTLKHAFELGGDGARFMQDFEDLDTENSSIGGLLIDCPGDNALKRNTDHFVRRGGVSLMCTSCSTTALLTMQTNAPAGGQGYRTSLRGGGPLTTLVIGNESFDTLWHTIWLNVLLEGRFLELCDCSKTDSSDKFPWLAETKPKATSMDIHPAQLFWAMPRRIRLDLENAASGICDVCGAESGQLISGYREVNRGTEYLAPIKHHLSPYDERKGKGVLGQPGGVTYRHWLGFIVPNAEIGIEPAMVVHECTSGGRQPAGLSLRLWAFGYDMDNMKARCWYEARMPLVQVGSSFREDYEHSIAGMIKAASQIAGNLRNAVKKAWFRRSADVKGDTSFLGSSFWRKTEPAFHETLHQLKEALESKKDAYPQRQRWLDALCSEALVLFDTYAFEGPIEDADPKRIVIARNELAKFNRSKKIKELLDLPIERQPGTAKTN